MGCGWKLEARCRAALLVAFPPRYERVIADHVTLSPFGAAPPASAGTARIVGHADDGKGVEAFVVAIDGATCRPDGLVWHVTWSLAQERAARESNDVIAARGWSTFDGPLLELVPATW